MKLTQANVDALKSTGKDTLIFDESLSGFGLRMTAVGTKIYVAQARVAGKAKRVTVGKAVDMTAAEAKRACRRILGQLANGVDPRDQRKSDNNKLAAKGITFKEFSDQWFEEIVLVKRKPSTIAGYRYTLDKFVLPVMGKKLLQSIAYTDIQELHYGYRSKKRTANYCVSLVRNILTYAEKLQLRPQGTNPCFRWEMYKEGKKERFLNDREMTLVADTIDEMDGVNLTPWAAAALRLALLTGARSSELKALEWTHIDHDRGLAVIPDSKNGDPRTLYLGVNGLLVIDALPRRGKYVIAGPEIDKPIHDLTHRWRKVALKCGLGDVRLHDLRHSYASAALADGMPLALVGRLLGHKSPLATARYAHLGSDPVAQAAHELGSKIAGTMRGETKSTGEIVRLKRNAG